MIEYKVYQLPASGRTLVELHPGIGPALHSAKEWSEKHLAIFCVHVSVDPLPLALFYGGRQYNILEMPTEVIPSTLIDTPALRLGGDQDDRK